MEEVFVEFPRIMQGFYFYCRIMSETGFCAFYQIQTLLWDGKEIIDPVFLAANFVTGLLYNILCLVTYSGGRGKTPG